MGTILEIIAMQSNEFSNIFLFYQDEVEAYELQKSVLSRNLPGALDELSNYTCHSIPHIQEVLDQSDYLFQGLQGWLIQDVGFAESELDIARIHLLLAAKFHDIGMAGTEHMRQLVSHVDKMYSSYVSNRSLTSSIVGIMNQQLLRLAEISENECSLWDNMPELYGPLCRAILGADIHQANYSDLLSRYHELVKNVIRKCHGEISARWIIEHRTTLKKRYCAKIDWDLVALIAALHTGSFYHHVDDHKMNRTCKDYCEYLCTILGMSKAIIEDERCFKKIQALASILRLADQRRSGSRLLTLSGNDISVIKTHTSSLQVEYTAHEARRHIHINRSNEIIISERLNDFGHVIVSRRNNQWDLCHELQFCPVDEMVSWQLLILRRIPSYVSEINDSLLGDDASFHHVLDISLHDQRDKQSVDRIFVNVDDILKLQDKDLDSDLKTIQSGLIDTIRGKPSRFLIEID